MTKYNTLGQAKPIVVCHSDAVKLASYNTLTSTVIDMVVKLLTDHMGVVYCLQPFAFLKETAHSVISILGILERIANLLDCDRRAFKLSLVNRAPRSSADLAADLQVR